LTELDSVNLALPFKLHLVKWNSTAGISLNQALYDQAVFVGLKAAKSTREFYQINAQLTESKL
jgi:hypothetical protein